MAIISENRLLGISKTRSFSETVLAERAPSFGNIAPLPSNVEALEAGLLFTRGLQPFVVIAGPSGVGKSEIIAATKRHCAGSAAMTAEQFLNTRSSINPRQPLLLDDCQAIIGKPRRMVMLRSALDRRVRGGCPTFLSYTTEKSVKNAISILPRTKLWAAYDIEKPGEEERYHLIMHLAKLEQLDLSPVLVKILAKWVDAPGRCLLGALHRLKLESSSWIDSAHVLRACGVLGPYFSGNSSWDLQHRVVATSHEFELNSSACGVSEMVCFTLLKTAQVGEESVARFLEMEPGDCYSQAVKFAKVRKACPQTASIHHEFVERIISRLLR